MFNFFKKIFGLPFNPYEGVTVRVEKDSLVEYAPGRHVILRELPFEFPGSCVDVVYMPGYRMRDGAPGRHLFTLLFTEVTFIGGNKSCEFDNKVHVVLVTQDKEGNLAWIQCRDRDDIVGRIGRRGYDYILENSMLNWGIFSVG